MNGDYPAWSSFPHVYAHLAHQLSARGHAVYRYAKLGPGTGSVPKDAPNAYFADLPGYGYAAVNKAAKVRWQKVMAGPQAKPDEVM